MWQVRKRGGNALEAEPKTAEELRLVTVGDAGAFANRNAHTDLKVELHQRLLDVINLQALDKMSRQQIEAEVGDIVYEELSKQNQALNNQERKALVSDVLDELLGLGPIEPLLKDPTITDILINGYSKVFVERYGVLEPTNVRFKDDRHLLRIIQKIVSAIGRRIDESAPLVDARLSDGSRVNAIIPPLAIDGASMSIRKFARVPISMERLIEIGSVPVQVSEVLKAVVKARRNVLISGGTGSGKTTLLNCLTAFIEKDERVITCEDSAELQLQQPHVVRLETRPPNLEGEGEITMRDLVKNCLRMRPERIIVGEVRGPEAFDLLQAMNTGHDGSMGTLHANSPREGLQRLESMITMGGFALPSKTIKEMITGSIDVIVQAARLRDGSRRITHITEVVGMEGDVIITQDLFVYEIMGEDANGRIVGRHRSTGIARPHFWDRARYYGEERRLAEALEHAEIRNEGEEEI